MCKTWCMHHRSVFECYTRYDINELVTIQLANSICVGLLASECMFVCVWGTKNPSCMCNKAAASTSVCSVHFAHFWNMRIKHKSGGEVVCPAKREPSSSSSPSLTELKRHLTVPAKHKNMPSAAATQRPREPNIAQTPPSRLPLCVCVYTSGDSQASCGVGLLRSRICLIRYVFSSLNCSSSVRSFWNLLRNSMSLVWFFSRMSRMGGVLLGLATNTWMNQE